MAPIILYAAAILVMLAAAVFTFGVTIISLYNFWAGPGKESPLTDLFINKRKTLGAAIVGAAVILVLIGSIAAYLGG